MSQNDAARNCSLTTMCRRATRRNHQLNREMNVPYPPSSEMSNAQDSSIQHGTEISRPGTCTYCLSAYKPQIHMTRSIHVHVQLQIYIYINHIHRHTCTNDVNDCIRLTCPQTSLIVSAFVCFIIFFWNASHGA